MINISKEFYLEKHNKNWYAINSRLKKQLEIKNEEVKILLDEINENIDLFKKRKSVLFQYIIISMLNIIEKIEVEK